MAKSKISVTIDDAVLERIDRATRNRSRSEVVEAALRQWLLAARRRRLEEEVAAYYTERGEAERLEDESWADLGAGQLRRTWE